MFLCFFRFNILFIADDIRNITGIHIKKRDLDEYNPILNFLFMLKSDEIEKCKNGKLSEIKKIDPELYKKIKKYNLANSPELNMLDDIRKNKRFKSVDDHIEYLITVKHKYKSFSELAKNEHLYRKIKAYNLSLEYIKEKIGFITTQ